MPPHVQPSQDDTPPPRFLTVDARVPPAIRQLLEEADGCLNMAFVHGGTAWARRPIEGILATERATGEDLDECLEKPKEKQTAVAPTLLQMLNILGGGDDPT